MKTKLLSAVAAIWLSSTANALPITYDFVSEPFVYENNPGHGVYGLTRLEGHFTIDLPNSSEGREAPILDWMFSDGLATVYSVNPDWSSRGEFSSDENGVLTYARLSVAFDGIAVYMGQPVGMGLRQFITVDPWRFDNWVDHCWYYFFADNGSRHCRTHYYPAGPVLIGKRPQTVPEPGAIALISGGLLAVAMFRRRRLHKTMQV
jgi:hypothetical protein